MNFKLWLEQRQGKISFDFDGVLHTDVYPNTIHPIDLYSSDLTPHYEMHKKLKEEAKNNSIIVVTARSPGLMEEVCWEFVKEHKLPVDKIYLTSGGPKEGLLSSLGVIRHYDDNPEMAEPLRKLGIEFVHVSSFGESTTGDGMMSTPKANYDSGLFRPQNWKPPRTTKNKKKKKDRVDKLFGIKSL